MTNFKIEFPEKFEAGICFNIYINDILYSHEICQSFVDGKYYLFCRPNNGIIFDLLHIDKHDFIKKIFWHRKFWKMARSRYFKYAKIST